MLPVQVRGRPEEAAEDLRALLRLACKSEHQEAVHDMSEQCQPLIRSASVHLAILGRESEDERFFKTLESDGAGVSFQSVAEKERFTSWARELSRKSQLQLALTKMG